MSSHDHTHEAAHVVPVATFVKVLVFLVLLTAITVGVSRIDFGVMNLVVAMVIASIKALTVALVFMHLKYENPLTWLYAAFPIVLLGVLLGGVFIDGPTRYIPEPVVIQGK